MEYLVCIVLCLVGLPHSGFSTPSFPCQGWVLWGSFQSLECEGSFLGPLGNTVNAESFRQGFPSG